MWDCVRLSAESESVRLYAESVKMSDTLTSVEVSDLSQSVRLKCMSHEAVKSVAWRYGHLNVSMYYFSVSD